MTLNSLLMVSQSEGYLVDIIANIPDPLIMVENLEYGVESLGR